MKRIHLVTPIVIVTLMLILGGSWYIWKMNGGDMVNSTKEKTAVYKNKKGEEWKIERGDYAFTVSSAVELPRITSGDINPLDVKVGDIQKMKIEVVDVVPLKGVTAYIETDNGTTTVSMHLTGTKALVYQKKMNGEYIKDITNNIYLNNVNVSFFNKIVDSVIRSADASGENVYTYEGEWVVRDTHTETYHTRFIAESMSGKTDEITLAWSDPVCSFYTDSVVNISASCSPSSGTEGFEYVTGSTQPVTQFGTTANITVTLTNAKFIVPSSLTLNNGGKFVIGSGGSIVINKRVCLTDADGDGYPASAALVECTSEGSGLRYASNIPVANRTVADCLDSSFSATNSCAPVCSAIATRWYKSAQAGCTAVANTQVWALTSLTYTDTGGDGAWGYFTPEVWDEEEEYYACAGYTDGYYAPNYGCGTLASAVAGTICDASRTVFCKYAGAPITCTAFTYSAYGACMPEGQQYRNILTATPSGCTGGSPVVSQACTYTPPTCSSWAYSAWGACQANNTQTRTVVTSYPSGCTGGSPVLSQSCTYVPPVTCTSWTYGAWSGCAGGFQTRSVLTSSPAGCTGGSPVYSQSCYDCGTGPYFPYAPYGCASPQKVLALAGQSSVVSGSASRLDSWTLKCVPKPSSCENMGCGLNTTLLAADYDCGDYVGGVIDDFETVCSLEYQIYCR